ncbi:MAG: phosphatase PAP2 family protein [Myxococcales bacterium]|nr:phosphatase PAP2 family protein [Myxococcales bacterium]
MVRPTVQLACAFLAVLSAVGLLSAPAAGAAQEADPLWRPHYRRAAPVDVLVMALGGGLYLTDHYLIPWRTRAVWSGPILLDKPVRELSAFEDRDARERSAEVSDWLFAGSVLHNMIFDNLLVAWAVHGEPGTAFQMTVMNLEAYAVAGALTGLVKTAAGRERPFARECRRDPGYTRLCGAPTSYRSFFSAHATTTAVGAGLLCAHHLHMPLYRRRGLDWATCGFGVGMTIFTGALRMTSDRHWLSDVVTGHLVGFAAGYLIPTLFFYEYNDGGRGLSGTRSTTTLLPFISGDQIGGQLLSFF